MLTGAAASFDDIAGLLVEEGLKNLPDRLMVAVKRSRVETAIRLYRAAILAEFHHIFSHICGPTI
jgi:hypothetical protein